MSHALARPAATEYAPFYADYIARVPEADVLAALESQIAVVRATLAAIPESRAGHRYAPEKWSIRQLVGHLSDAERVMSYRALRFGRNDPTPLPGFEENDYVVQAPSETCRLADLASEWEAVRRASLHLFTQFQPAAWTRSGTANDSPVTVRALGFILVGHARHHLEVLATRYA